MELESRLGLPVDVLAKARDAAPTPFQAIALSGYRPFKLCLPRIPIVNILDSERAHLAGLLEALQRCVYFLDASDKRLTWPLAAEIELQVKTETAIQLGLEATIMPDDIIVHGANAAKARTAVNSRIDSSLLHIPNPTI